MSIEKDENQLNEIQGLQESTGTVPAVQDTTAEVPSMELSDTTGELQEKKGKKKKPPKTFPKKKIPKRYLIFYKHR